MKALQGIKEKIGKSLLRKRSTVNRDRRGYDLNKASHITIFYTDTDEDRYKCIREFSKALKDEYGTKRVKAVAFLEGSEKDVPIYHAHKLEADYITSDDLSWNLKASLNFRNILNEACDILIDIGEKENLRMHYALKYSRASMIVGRKDSPREDYYDISINAPTSVNMDVFLNEVEGILGKLNIQ